MTEITPTEQLSTTSNPNFVGNIIPEAPTTILDKSSGPQKIDTTISIAREGEIELYSEKFGRPFLITHLNIADIYGKGEFKSEADAIDNYIQSEIKTKEYQPTKNSYLKIFNELMQKMNVDPLLNYDQKLSRVHTYVSILNKQKELDARKRALEYVSSRQ